MTYRLDFCQVVFWFKIQITIGFRKKRRFFLKRFVIIYLFVVYILNMAS